MPDRQSDKTCAAEAFLERPVPHKDSLTNELMVQMQFADSKKESER